ncbi:MAG: membrane protein FdrA [Firmicutes bacterium ADurb.Bin182]|nr:MAG: membrane protein FdrA [Firmicutes bacterium ADurb.Bin182]
MSNNLLKQKPIVLNEGLEVFADELQQNGVDVIQLDWKPPASGNIELNKKLARVLLHKNEIDKANRKAVDKVLNARPVWVDVGLAKDVIPGFEENTISHAGPPVTWENMCGPMQGSVIGGLIYEKRAKNEAEARKVAASGEYKFVPNHELSTVGPMTGVLTANMPVMVVENKENGNLAYAPFNTEGKGKPFSFGAFGEDTQEMLRYITDTIAPAMKIAVRSAGGIDLKNIIARALNMGDDCHNRLVSATSLLWKSLIIELAKNRVDYEVITSLGYTMYYNDWFFLNQSMAACKATMDAARNIPCSTMVTAMARNGTEVGIQVSGLGTQWFTAKAPKVKGLYFPGFTEEDANPDLGDSAITETAGIGAFAMAAALPMTKLVGGTVADAINFSKTMRRITLAENPAYTIPTLDFIGTPTGIDVLKVLEKGIIPVINTGIASKRAGEGVIGAGIVNMPMEVFEKALMAMPD